MCIRDRRSMNIISEINKNRIAFYAIISLILLAISAFWLTISPSVGQACNNETGCNYTFGNGDYTYDNYNQSPTVTIYVDDTSISYNHTTVIRWYSDYADYCTASGGTNGWSGRKSTSGSFNTGSLTSDKTYRISCRNNDGSDSDSITVYVGNRNTNNYQNNSQSEPTSTTISATNIDTNSATLNGKVNGNGHSANVWFEYGTSVNLGSATSQSSYSSGTNNYSKTISNLSPNTIYYYRAIAENTSWRNLGSILTFKTKGVYVAPIARVTPKATTVKPTPIPTPGPATAPVTNQISYNFSLFPPANNTAPVETWKELPKNTTPDSTTSETAKDNSQSANAISANFLPTSLFGWVILLIMGSILVILAKYLLSDIQPWGKEVGNIPTDHHQ